VDGEHLFHECSAKVQIADTPGSSKLAEHGIKCGFILAAPGGDRLAYHLDLARGCPDFFDISKFL
jgi:hypothetical protein